MDTEEMKYVMILLTFYFKNKTNDQRNEIINSGRDFQNNINVTTRILKLLNINRKRKIYIYAPDVNQ